MKEFLVCIDSDGCVFDNMELKHKECFCPATVNVWDLQSVSRYAREAADFVNLYSDTRGVNRYPGIIRTLKLLSERKEVSERGYVCPDMTPLQKWIDKTDSLSIGALKAYCEEIGHSEPVLETTLKWSMEVDENIARIVRNAANFLYTREALQKFSDFAEIVIVSQTPKEAIVREWKEHDILKYTTMICGQEDGSKSACIRKAMDGRFDPDRVLMIGDAPGDLKAAEDNGVLFFPIIPNREEESWKAALDVAVRFKEKTYKGPVMEGFLQEFDKALLKEPSWSR